MKPLALLLALVALTAFLLTSSCQSSRLANRRDAQRLTLTNDSLTRSYWLHLPPQLDTTPLPLLLCYHGYTSNARNLMTYSNFNNIADREGFIVVYPQGTPLKGKNHWNVGGWTRESTVDDVAFTRALIDTLSQRHPIDTHRIYATGMSNGGYMSLLLACQLADRIAAVASVTGSMTPEMYRDCAPQRPIPILQLHGTADPVVPYRGGYDWTVSIDSTLQYWIAHNSADTTAIVQPLPNRYWFDFSRPTFYHYPARDSTSAEVQHYQVRNGRHDWFGAWGNRDIHASEIIWRFLSPHRLPE